MTDATTDELDAFIALRDALVQAKDKLAQHILANAGGPETERLQNLVVHCGHAITSLTAHSIGILGTNTATAVAQLKSISKYAESFVKEIANIKKGLKVVTSLLTLAASVMVGDVSGLLGSLDVVEGAIADGLADA